MILMYLENFGFQLMPNQRLTILIFFLFTTFVVGQNIYLDQFGTVSYANNDGNSNFGTNWQESNDDGSPNGGRIFISGGELVFSDIDGRFIIRNLDLSGATSVTLTLDYDATSRGNETLAVYLFDTSTGFFEVIDNINTTNTGSITHTLTTNEISANSAIAFGTGSGNWNNGEVITIDNVQFSATFPPVLIVEDISVAEDDGTVTLVVTHDGGSATGSFTATYATSAGSADENVDYTGISGGVLNFNGTTGDTDNIVITILDDSFYELDETFTIAFTAVSDPSVDITDTATVTITDDEVILSEVPLTLFEEFNGYFDYTVAGGSLRDQDNITNPCSIVTSSTATGLTSDIPTTATVKKAFLLWAHSNQIPDTEVTFEGQSISAELVYSSSVQGNVFFGMLSDVTTIIEGITDPSNNTYDFTDLDIDNTDNVFTYCSTNTVLGGWSLIVFYEDPNLPAVSVNMYHGFKGESNTSNSYTLDGFFAIGSVGAKTTVLSWEGDATLDGNSAGTTNPNGESLIVTNQAGNSFTLTGDGGQTGNNAYNSTIYDNTVAPVVNISNSYGVDLDTYDISPYIAAADSEITVGVNAGQDYVIANMVLVKVPSNLIVGNIFEDVNYGGGVGRDLITSNGVGIEGVSVELYDNTNTFIESVTTDTSGDYTMGGMANGSFSVRVVNNTIRSTRGGGTTCNTCVPVQTYRRNYATAGGFANIIGEVGGANPAGQDSNAGTLNNAQSVSNVTITSEGVVGLDFGFNFNTIVNTNEDGQGSLEQFIVNSNNLDQATLDIEANGIFDPAATEDTSIFMIPVSGDPLGRTADSNYIGGYLDIDIPDGDSLTSITGTNTVIDGRTQTAYSGDTNGGTIGAGGTTVGTSANVLPNYNRPEIQIHRGTGDVLKNSGTNTVIRNVSVFGGNNAAVRIDGGSATIANSFLGVNANGTNGGNVDFGVEITDGTVNINGNYIAANTDAGIVVNGGTASIIQNNQITNNGNGACNDNILLQNGLGVVIQQNLIENAASLGIDADAFSGNASILENTIVNSGQNGGLCNGNVENSGILLDGNNSTIAQNIISNNGGAGIVLGNGNFTGNLISQNSIFANGGLGIDIDQSGEIGDGVTLNDSGDADNGPNGSLNFPIITSAYKLGANLVISGWSRPGATIEVFLTDVNEGTATAGDNQFGQSTDYGEGQVYLGTVVEGSASDTNAGVSSYTDADGNTDNTNMFQFSISLPVAVALGEFITSTATITNSTSEFSPLSIVRVRTVITNRRITYRVNPN